MSEAEIPLDLSFVLELAKPPSLEEELQLEKEIRTIRATDDIEGATVTYKERTGANTATVQRGDYEFEVFLDELETPEEF